jgi:hypothetical protein
VVPLPFPAVVLSFLSCSNHESYRTSHRNLPLVQEISPAKTCSRSGRRRTDSTIFFVFGIGNLPNSYSFSFSSRRSGLSVKMGMMLLSLMDRDCQQKYSDQIPLYSLFHFLSLARSLGWSIFFAHLWENESLKYYFTVLFDDIEILIVHYLQSRKRNNERRKRIF